MPETNWRFVRWNSGDGFLCEGSTNPVCSLSNVGFGAVPELQALIETDTIFYIMPVFEFAGLPLEVINAADGRQWAQPGNLSGVTYNEIAAACPGGVCSGMLGGYNLDGWTWATGLLVRNLFNAYSPTACVGFPCLTTDVTPVPYVANMIADGFDLTQSLNGFELIDGYTSEPEPTSYAGVIRLQNADCSVVGCVAQVAWSNVDSSSPQAGPPEGVWLYR